MTDYLAPAARILWVRPALIAAAVQRLDGEIHHLFDECVRSGEPAPRPELVYATPEDILALSELVPSTYLTDVHPPHGGPPLAVVGDEGEDSATGAAVEPGAVPTRCSSVRRKRKLTG